MLLLAKKEAGKTSFLGFYFLSFLFFVASVRGAVVCLERSWPCPYMVSTALEWFAKP